MEPLSRGYCSVAKLCPTLCDPMDCSTPGFPVLHHLLEFAQTHVRWVSDIIQPSCPLLSSSTPTFDLSRIRDFSNGSALCIRWPKCWRLSLNISAKYWKDSVSVLLMNIQDWFPLGLTGLISLLSKRFSRVFFSTIIWRHQFFSAQPLLSSSHIRTCLLEKPQLQLYRPLSAK